MIDNHIPTKTNLEDLSNDERNNLMRAMKKPEFMGLMNDYMLEISDPKNKDEYDEYLKQLAKDGELPKGLKLIRPDPEFCMKTTMTAQKDKGQDQKLFINICSSNIVGRPSFENREVDGKVGQSWSLPYSAGKIRYDQTKKEEVCNTIDVAFHNYAFELISRNPRFQEIICSTGLEAAVKQLGERTETISQDYKILKNTKCKGGTPALLTVRVSGKAQKQDKNHISEMEQRQGGEGQAPKLYNDLMKQKDEYKKEKQEKENQNNEHLNQEYIDEEEAQEQEKFQYNEQGERIIKVPKNKIVYTYPVDYADFLDHTKEQRKIPIEIGLDVHLLGVDSVKEVELDINDDKVIIQVPKKYFLEKNLPYKVLKDSGTAKFDSKKKMLRIRLKIDKSSIKQEEDVQQKAITRRFNEAKTENEDEDDQYDLKVTKENPEETQQATEKQQDLQENTQNQLNKDSTLEVNEKPEEMLHFVKEEENRVFIPDDKPNLQVTDPEAEQAPDSDEEELELLKQQKPNIEEIQPQQETEVQEQKEQIIQKVYSHLDFQSQEDSNKFFFIINIPKYEKEGVNYVIFEKQVLLKYEDNKKVQYLRISLENDIIEDQSTVSLVTDYVVINLVKLKSTFWDKKGFEQIKEDFEDFKQLFEELQEANNILQQEKEQQKQLKQQNKESKQQNLNDLDDDDDKKEEENQENQIEEKNEEKTKLELEMEERDKLMEKIKKRVENQKNIIQFLDFHKSAEWAYDIE